MRPCNVCGSPLENPVYVSPQGLSITSLTEVRNGRTEVFFCTACGHLQTTPIEDLEDYYETQYRILIDSENEDQLYQVVDSRRIYRVPHQVETLLTKVDLAPRARVLDYGCAKGATARRLAEVRQGAGTFVASGAARKGAAADLIRERAAEFTRAAMDLGLTRKATLAAFDAAWKEAKSSWAA